MYVPNQNMNPERSYERNRVPQMIHDNYMKKNTRKNQYSSEIHDQINDVVQNEYKYFPPKQFTFKDDDKVDGRHLNRYQMAYDACVRKQKAIREPAKLGGADIMMKHPIPKKQNTMRELLLRQMTVPTWGDYKGGVIY